MSSQCLLKKINGFLFLLKIAITNLHFAADLKQRIFDLVIERAIASTRHLFNMYVCSEQLNLKKLIRFQNRLQF